MNRILTVPVVFGLVAASILLAFAVSGIILGFGLRFHPDRELYYTHLSLFIGQGAIILPAFIFLKFRGESIRSRFRLHPVSASVVFSVVILSVGIIILADEMDRVMSLFFPLPSALERLADIFKLTSARTMFLVISAVVIIAPLGEELLFRGFLQKFLEDNWRDITRAVLVTSLFFAFTHMNPYWLIQIYVLGVLLGYLAWRTGSILPSFILHGMNNGFALLLANTVDNSAVFYTWHNHVSPIVLVFAVICVYFGFKWLHKSLEIQR